jgi:hypothetical protein
LDQLRFTQTSDRTIPPVLEISTTAGITALHGPNFELLRHGG